MTALFKQAPSEVLALREEMLGALQKNTGAVLEVFDKIKNKFENNQDAIKMQRLHEELLNRLTNQNTALSPETMQTPSTKDRSAIETWANIHFRRQQTAMKEHAKALELEKNPSEQESEARKPSLF